MRGWTRYLVSGPTVYAGTELSDALSNVPTRRSNRLCGDRVLVNIDQKSIRDLLTAKKSDFLHGLCRGERVDGVVAFVLTAIAVSFVSFVMGDVVGLLTGSSSSRHIANVLCRLMPGISWWIL